MPKWSYPLQFFHSSAPTTAEVTASSKTMEEDLAGRGAVGTTRIRIINLVAYYETAACNIVIGYKARAQGAIREFILEDVLTSKNGFVRGNPYIELMADKLYATVNGTLLATQTFTFMGTYQLAGP